MAFKFVVLAACLAVANAGLLAAPAAVGYAAPAYGHAIAAPAITAQHSNILRTPGNLGQISTYSKSIDTPYSSVRKSDVRVSNDALAYGAYGAIAAPALAAPAIASPLAARLAAPAIAAPLAARAIASPLAAPALVAPGLAAPLAARAAIAPAGLLGVAYSAAPAVAHMTYSNGLGIAYAY